MLNKKSKKSPGGHEAEASWAQRGRSRSKGARARHFRLNITLAVILGLLSVSITAVTAWAFNVTNSPYNLPNVYIEGVYVGSMTKEQTIQSLEQAGWREKAAEPLRVELPAGVSFELDYIDSGIVLSLEEAAELASSYGHSHNVYGNLGKYLKNQYSSVDLAAESHVNAEYVRSRVDEAIASFMEKTADTGYEPDMENGVVRLMKGAGQMQIDAEKLTEQAIAYMQQGKLLLEKKLPDNQLAMPDFQLLHDEICVEAQDAVYGEKFEVIDEVIGLGFDVEAAKQSWEKAAPTEYYEISLELVQPEITGDELRSRLYRDRLGSQTTLYTYSSDNRINNIALAASKFNGMILYPGDTFSFNEVVGKRTEEAGFLSAGAYSDGEVVQEIGGGICQVSSTLYCASMYAQMKTVYRESHYFKVDYLPVGYDATVSWSKPDFKFRNDREYPVKLVTYCNNELKTLTVEIWGTDVDGSYVELTCWEEPIFDEEFTDVVIGTNALAYRNIYDKYGNFIKKVQEPYSVYHLHEDEIEWPEDAIEEDEDDEDNPDILSGILGALNQQDNGSILIP